MGLPLEFVPRLAAYVINNKTISFTISTFLILFFLFFCPSFATVFFVLGGGEEVESLVICSQYKYAQGWFSFTSRYASISMLIIIANLGYVPTSIYAQTLTADRPQHCLLPIQQTDMICTIIIIVVGDGGR